MMDEICGKCKWHVRDDFIEKDWVCANEDSEYSGCMTEYLDIPHAQPVIVLANRVQYLQDMQINYEKTGICLSGRGQSKAAKAEHYPKEVAL